MSGNNYHLVSDNSLQLITIENKVTSIRVAYNFKSADGRTTGRNFVINCRDEAGSQWSYFIEECTQRRWNWQRVLRNVPSEELKHWIITKSSTHLKVVCNKLTVLNFNFATDCDPDKRTGKDIWSGESDSCQLFFDHSMLLMMQ